MALGSVGLQTSIWNNNLRSMILLACFPILLLAITWAGFVLYAYSDMSAYANGNEQPFVAGLQGLKKYGAYVVAGVFVWFVIAYLYNQQIINAATHAKPVTRAEQPRIYNLLENLCISRGITMPDLQIIQTNAMNAFASGISEGNFRITLTTGIIEALDDRELEAVLAHELTHIINRDVRLVIISIVFVGIISFVCDMAWRSMRYGRWQTNAAAKSVRGGSGKGGNLAFAMLIAAAVLAVSYLFAIFIRFALSRRREFMADAGAVELTKNPDAMISALQKISGRSEIPNISADFKELMLENARTDVFDLFMTHPPIEKRIAALVGFGGRVSKPMNLDINDNNPWD